MPLILPDLERKRKEREAKMAKEQRDEERWYGGNAELKTTPIISGPAPKTSLQVVSDIYSIYEKAPDYGNKLMQDFSTLQQDKTSSFYSPYLKPTNTSPLQTLAGLGLSVGTVDNDWFERNKNLQNYFRVGADGAPLAPTKKSSRRKLRLMRTGSWLKMRKQPKERSWNGTA